MPDYLLQIINTPPKLETLAAKLSSVSVIALDIETIDWWDRFRERVALVQIAYRTAEQNIGVAVINALAKLDTEALRAILESPATVKAIHNAAFDAAKLFKHYRLRVAPIFDTMVAARRNGERKYSLAAQAEVHLKLRLDKGAQHSDWSRRPLDIKQLDYAARDAYATLLLYEHQMGRNLAGSYSPKMHENSPAQGRLELLEPSQVTLRDEGEEAVAGLLPPARIAAPIERRELTAEAQVALAIIGKFPERYSPARLAAAVGAGRVGVAGWIVDQALGRAAEFDQETAQLVIAELFAQKLIRLTDFQKLVLVDNGQTILSEQKIQ